MEIFNTILTLLFIVAVAAIIYPFKPIKKRSSAILLAILLFFMFVISSAATEGDLTVFGILWMMFMLLLIVAVAAIIYPFKPIKKRSSAVLLAIMSMVCMAVIINGPFVFSNKILDLNDKTKISVVSKALNPKLSGDKSALTVQTDTTAIIPNACGDGGLILNDIVAVTGVHVLRKLASSKAPKIKNEKASTALGEAIYHRIDNSTTVRRLCAQSEWTKIQIATPEWLTDIVGWVPNEALREIVIKSDGARVYVEEDFYWDNDTKKFKTRIVGTINRISKENPNCKTIDASSVAKSSSRSKQGDPVFYVTCGTGMNAFNVWFRPNDISAGNSFQGVKPLARNAAVDACEAQAQHVAMHPSTVSFSRIWDLAYMPHASGRTRVVSTFTAKNSFDLELSYRINCLFDGPKLIEAQIVEKID